MKKLFILFACLLSIRLFADISSNSSKIDESNPVIIEFRPSYFLPSSQLLRDVYGAGGIEYQLTGMVPIYQGTLFWARCFDVWWAVDYFKKSGHSELEHTRTDITMVPLTLGMKYAYSRGIWRPYVGVGMKYWFVNIHNHSKYVMKHTNVSGMGGVAEGGFLVFLGKYWNLDFYTSYSFKEFKAPHSKSSNIEMTDLQVGGWNFGAGIGVKW